MRSRNEKATETTRRNLFGLWGFWTVFAAIGFLLGSTSAFARPWAEHKTHLMTLGKQIETHESEIHALISKKRHLTDTTELAALMKEISEHHVALEKAAKQYEEEREHVRYEHPEKNDELNHRYTHVKVKSIEEMEAGFGLDGRLDRIKARVLNTFPIPERKHVARSTKPYSRHPASTDDEDTPEKVHLIK